MTAASEVDDAMEAVLGPSAAVDHSAANEVAEPGQGPCSEAEAEQLVERAITAAETFYDAVVEIIRRQAWVPLGYANPRDLMLRRLGGTTVNPSSGKPYSRAHVHRMARVSWMLWAISERTGVDPGDLTIPERTLRELGGGMNADLELVDTISDRVANAINDKDASPDDVQDVIDSALSDAVSRPPAASDDEGDEDYDRAPIDTGSGLSQLGEGRTDSAGRGGGGDDFDDDGDGLSADDAGRAPVSPAMSAFDSPDDYDDFDDPTPTIKASDALSQMRAVADFTRHMEDIQALAEHLPDVAKVEKMLPQFLDIIDDDELEQFTAMVEQNHAFIDRAQKAKDAMAAVLETAKERLDYI